MYQSRNIYHKSVSISYENLKLCQDYTNRGIISEHLTSFAPSMKVIWNEDGRDKSTLDSFFKDLGEENCGRIEAAASDMANGASGISQINQ